MSLPFHSSDGVTAQREPQRRLMFRSRDILGQPVYLHFCDLTKTTPRRDQAWQGTERQAHNVRAKFPIARSMSLVRIN